MSIFLYDGNDKVVSGIGKCNIEDLKNQDLNLFLLDNMI